MSTIKSSDEHLTLNADGSGKSVKFQANGVEKASISSSGAFTSTTIDATKLTGTIPNFTSTGIDDNADATAMTIDSGERIGIGNTVAGTMNSVNSSILTIGTGSGHSGMTVYTGSTNEGTINFADDTSGSGTYKGMVRYDHITNALTLHSNATEAIKMDSTGAVTMSKQPAFLVNKNADQTLTSSAEVTVTWENEIYDVGSDFASSTFTAPVTGKYFLRAQTRIDNFDSAAVYYRLGIETSNYNKLIIFDPNFSSDLNYYTMQIASVFEMDAGDTAQVKFIQNSGTFSHIDDTSAYTNFCGYLLG